MQVKNSKEQRFLPLPSGRGLHAEDRMKKKRYIVSGGFMEYMAHYQCEAESASSALPQMQDIYLWGEMQRPARVYIEAQEDDAEVVEEGR